MIPPYRPIIWMVTHSLLWGELLVLIFLYFSFSNILELKNYIVNSIHTISYLAVGWISECGQRIAEAHTTNGMVLPAALHR